MIVTNNRLIVAKEVYGYIILTSIAILLGIAGIWIIMKEARKQPENRNAAKIVLGLCVASGGSLVMLITILSLVSRK